MRVGIDDTDSPAGGCTTYFALEAAAAFLREHGLVLRARPRLVRLNPNIPWKTRGNAAVALDLGLPAGPGGALAGVAPDGTQVLLDSAAQPAAPAPRHAATLDRLIEGRCDLGAKGTDPAYVMASAGLPSGLYERAVRGVVDPAAVRAELTALPDPPIWRALGDGRGIVGASAAAAYPAVDPTFEIIVYRQEARWGSKRAVGYDSVERMDRAYRTTYHNIDRANRHAAITPSTPCPLLFGIRATSPDELQEAAASVEAGEPWGGWFLFETNQGTDAHVVERAVADVEPMLTVRVSGAVSKRPRSLKGGHVVFAVTDGKGAELECAAYEPTKQFRDLVGKLEVGDRVRAVGAIREDRRTLNLEKIEICSAVPRQPKDVNPPCPSCGRRLKSAGRGAPLRCRACGTKAPRPTAAAEPPPSGPAPGWYEVPICARRHLARPIDPHGYEGAGRLQ